MPPNTVMHACKLARQCRNAQLSSYPPSIGLILHLEIRDATTVIRQFYTPNDRTTTVSLYGAVVRSVRSVPPSCQRRVRILWRHLLASLFPVDVMEVWMQQRLKMLYDRQCMAMLRTPSHGANSTRFQSTPLSTHPGARLPRLRPLRDQISYAIG